MGRTVYSCGTVAKGDFAGKNVYHSDESSLIIVSNDEKGKIIVQSLFPTKYEILQTISLETVEKYECVTDKDIALYFKNGRKSLITFKSEAYKKVKRILFNF